MNPEIKPQLGLTPKMQKVHERLSFEHESLMDAFWRLQFVSRLSSRELGDLCNVPSYTIQRWMKKFDYKSPLSKEEIEAKRVAVIKATWQDPDSRQRIIGLIHTPESDQLRRNSLARYTKEHSGDYSTSAQRMVAIFGNNPKEELEKLYWVENMSAVGIANLLLKNSGKKIAPYVIRDWIKRLGIKKRTFSEVQRLNKAKGSTGARIKPEILEAVARARENGGFDTLPKEYRDVLNRRFPNQGKPATLKEVGEDLGGLTREAIRLREKAALIQLASLS